MSTRRCLTCELLSNELLCPSCGMSTFIRGLETVDARAVEPGTVIAHRYRVEGLLGRGGCGSVFAARHTATDQELALKILDMSGGPSDQLIRRFFQEAKVTASLKHPNTVRVFDFGQDDSGVVFIAMERLEGRTLSEELMARLDQGRAFSDREASHLCVEILRSLTEAHAAGLVHRDLKPANIFLHRWGQEDAAVKVLDFGVAKMNGSDLSRVRVAPCTPEFASPEQARGQPVDGRSDIYALGVLLFHLVTGELPFNAKERRDILFLQASRPPPNLRQWPGVSLAVGFIDIVEQALAKSPDDRFLDAAEMKLALEEWVQGSTRTGMSPRAAADGAPEPVVHPTMIPETSVRTRPQTEGHDTRTPLASEPLEETLVATKVDDPGRTRTAATVEGSATARTAPEVTHPGSTQTATAVTQPGSTATAPGMDMTPVILPSTTAPAMYPPTAPQTPRAMGAPTTRGRWRMVTIALLAALTLVGIVTARLVLTEPPPPEAVAPPAAAIRTTGREPLRARPRTTPRRATGSTPQDTARPTTPAVTPATPSPAAASPAPKQPKRDARRKRRRTSRKRRGQPPARTKPKEAPAQPTKPKSLLDFEI